MAIQSGIPYFQELFCEAVGNQLVDLPSNPAYFVQAASVLNFNGWGGRTGTVQAGARVYLGAIQPWNAIEKRGLIWEVPDVRPNLGTVLNGATPIFGQLAAGTYPLIVVGVYNTLLSTDDPFGLQTGGGTLVISGALPSDPPADPIPEGKYEQQIVTWTGDGTAARLISTSFPLDTGISVVWVFSQGPHIQTPVFRHSLMSVSSVQGGTTSSLGGIMSLVAGGFTVTDRAASNMYVNILNSKYTAIVFHDTTVVGPIVNGVQHGRYLAIGSYMGAVSHTFTPNVITNDSHFYFISGFGWTADDHGRAYTIASPADSGVFGYISTTLGASNKLWAGSAGQVSGTLLAAGKRLRSGFSDLAFLGLTNQMAFITGLWGDWRPTNLVGDKTYWMETVALGGTGFTDKMTALNSSGDVVLGSSNDINTAAQSYFWFTLSTAVPSAMFTLYHGVGTGSPITISVPGMTPGFAVNRIDDTAEQGAWWRGPSHSSANSSAWGGAGDATGRLTAFGTGTITIGALGAPSGKSVDGFALVTGEVVATYDPPIYPNQPDINETLLLGSPVTPLFTIREGRGIVLNVPDPNDPNTAERRWLVDRVDVKVWLEEES